MFANMLLARSDTFTSNSTAQSGNHAQSESGIKLVRTNPVLNIYYARKDKISFHDTMADLYTAMPKKGIRCCTDCLGRCTHRMHVNK